MINIEKIKIDQLHMKIGLVILTIISFIVLHEIIYPIEPEPLFSLNASKTGYIIHGTAHSSFDSDSKITLVVDSSNNRFYIQREFENGLIHTTTINSTSYRVRWIMSDNSSNCYDVKGFNYTTELANYNNLKISSRSLRIFGITTYNGYIMGMCGNSSFIQIMQSGNIIIKMKFTSGYNYYIGRGLPCLERLYTLFSFDLGTLDTTSNRDKYFSTLDCHNPNNYSCESF